MYINYFAKLLHPTLGVLPEKILELLTGPAIL